MAGPCCCEHHRRYFSDDRNDRCQPGVSPSDCAVCECHKTDKHSHYGRLWHARVPGKRAPAQGIRRRAHGAGCGTDFVVPVTGEPVCRLVFITVLYRYPLFHYASRKHHTSNSGTSRNFTQSNTPRSVMRSAGMTVSARKERYINGRSIPPICRVTELRRSNRVTTSSKGSVDIRPAQSSGRTVAEVPVTTAMPPCACMTDLTASRISSSLTPEAMILWASWEILAAMAPRSNEKPCTSPTPHLPVPYRL